MSHDVVVAIEINRLPKRLVENINPCKLPRTVVRAGPRPWAPWFMRNFRKKKEREVFFSSLENWMEKAAFVL